jgi:hypothetical protein
MVSTLTPSYEHLATETHAVLRDDIRLRKLGLVTLAIMGSIK